MKNIFKYILIFCVIFITSLSLTTVMANSDMPKFNFLNGDYKTLRGANFTQGETDWHDPVSAKLGDTINWNVYLHNGVEGTTAHDVHVQVDMPSNQSSEHILKAEIDSDDTNVFSDTAKLISNEDLNLEYITGTTELWDRNGHKVKDLPDGITKDGINIGDIQGCWPYAVFVVFKTKTFVTPVGEVDIYKYVRNVEKNEEFTGGTLAKTTDKLEYQIVIENNSNIRVDFKIIDHLPEYVEYSQDSLIAEFNNHEITIYDQEEDLFDTYKQLHLEAGKTMRLTFQAMVKETTPIGTIFVNQVDLITADDFKSAQAKTTIISTPILGKVGEVLGASTLPVTGNPISVSLALAFAATCIYYSTREKQLFVQELQKVRFLN